MARGSVRQGCDATGTLGGRQLHAQLRPIRQMNAPAQLDCVILDCCSNAHRGRLPAAG